MNNGVTQAAASGDLQNLIVCLTKSFSSLRYRQEGLCGSGKHFHPVSFICNSKDNRSKKKIKLNTYVNEEVPYTF